MYNEILSNSQIVKKWNDLLDNKCIICDNKCKFLIHLNLNDVFYDSFPNELKNHIIKKSGDFLRQYMYVNKHNLYIEVKNLSLKDDQIIINDSFYFSQSLVNKFKNFNTKLFNNVKCQDMYYFCDCNFSNKFYFSTYTKYTNFISTNNDIFFFNKEIEYITFDSYLIMSKNNINYYVDYNNNNKYEEKPFPFTKEQIILNKNLLKNFILLK